MGVNAEINVVSLIDVMMLLMVIFMITAPIMQGGVEIALPEADVRPVEAKAGLTVTVDRRGRIFVDETEFSLAEFSAGVKPLYDKAGGGAVYLRADQDGNYGIVLKVIGAVTRAGIPNVSLIGVPESGRQ
ncbi:MAG: biopolymer transporter ExbD [Gemmatimonadota bacterium]